CLLYFVDNLHLSGLKCNHLLGIFDMSDQQNGSAIALLQQTSLPSLVQKELERMILSGDLASGDKLNEASLAAMLGVSRGPVREALLTLKESGLVRQEKN